MTTKGLGICGLVFGSSFSSTPEAERLRQFIEKASSLVPGFASLISIDDNCSNVLKRNTMHYFSLIPNSNEIIFQAILFGTISYTVKACPMNSEYIKHVGDGLMWLLDYSIKEVHGSFNQPESEAFLPLLPREGSDPISDTPQIC